MEFDAIAIDQVGAAAVFELIAHLVMIENKRVEVIQVAIGKRQSADLLKTSFTEKIGDKSIQK